MNEDTRKIVENAERELREGARTEPVDFKVERIRMIKVTGRTNRVSYIDVGLELRAYAPKPGRRWGERFWEVTWELKRRVLSRATEDPNGIKAVETFFWNTGTNPWLKPYQIVRLRR